MAEDRQYQRIGLLGRLDGADESETLVAVTSYLEEQGYEVAVDLALSQVFRTQDYQRYAKAALARWADLVIVVGGDGSFISAARTIAPYETPVVGINRGRLGFLTDLAPDNFEEVLSPMLSGKCVRESRSMLSAHVMRHGQKVSQGTALNDIIVHPGRSARMIEVELWVDGVFVYNLRADGLIVATPTGSTAYALSGGGPILHPSMDAFIIVPMFPHILSSRPIVVNGDSEVMISLTDSNNAYPEFTCDGQEHFMILPGDEIRLQKAEHTVDILHPVGHDFYQVARSKLGWSSTPGKPEQR